MLTNEISFDVCSTDSNRSFSLTGFRSRLLQERKRVTQLDVFVYNQFFSGVYTLVVVVSKKNKKRSVNFRVNI